MLVYVAQSLQRHLTASALTVSPDLPLPPLCTPLPFVPFRPQSSSPHLARSPTQSVCVCFCTLSYSFAFLCVAVVCVRVVFVVVVDILFTLNIFVNFSLHCCVVVVVFMQ